MNQLFSHLPEPTETALEASTPAKLISIYLEAEMRLEELWLAFTEYTHLWWPADYKANLESYLEFDEQYFTEYVEEEANVRGETRYFSPEDVIAVEILESALKGSFVRGLSFVFDQEEDGTSVLDICSGIIKPRDLVEEGAAASDVVLGIWAEDKKAALEILGSFARFIGTEIQVETNPEN